MPHKGAERSCLSRLLLPGKAPLFLALLLALALPTAAQAEALWMGVVEKVIDGDSLLVLRDGEEVEVRLYGVDCPEHRQPYGKQAYKFTRHHAAPGTKVTIYPKGKDSHGRVLARVFIEKKEFNVEIIRAGMAWWYARYAPLMTSYFDAQKEAKKFSRGLWIDADPMPPWLWRKKNK